MAFAGERDVELGIESALGIVEWLKGYRPAARGLGANLTVPRHMWIVDSRVSGLIHKLVKYAYRSNASPSIRLTRDELTWFADKVKPGGMFGSRGGIELPSVVNQFCLRCKLGMKRRQGAPMKSARGMIAATKIERANGADGARAVRRLRRKIEDARRYANWASTYEGLGAKIVRAVAEEFD